MSQVKKCKECTETLPLVNFHVRETTSKYTGRVTRVYQHICKECNKSLCRLRRRTRKGAIRSMYSGQIGSSKQRGHVLPDYTLQDLVEWVTSNTAFEALYLKWVDSGYSRWCKPSCDRLDDYSPYTLANLQLTTWEQNAKNYKVSMVNGINTKVCKEVNQYTLEGELLNTFHSIQEAARSTGCAAGNLMRVCKGQYKTSKGFIWRYSDEPFTK